ncbi:protein translocase subunit SecF [Thiolapillus sp.]
MRTLTSSLHFDFMGKRKLAMFFSITLIVISLASLAIRGLVFGIDFTGGTLIEVGYAQDADPGKIREVLAENGFDEAQVQQFGAPRDILIRLAPRKGVKSSELSDKVFELLSNQAGGKVELRRVEFVGPQVGDELTEDGALAVLVALMAILMYVAVRFEWRFAVGSVIALVHDVTITLGFFSVFQMEFDLTVLAAVLAVIGYSLNDTIVVFDRIRENFRKIRKGDSQEIINTSLNQTLARTIVTSLTTLIVLLALFVLGGEIIHNFSLALILGIVIGTYSSIYVASSAVLMLGVSKADLMPVQKEGQQIDDMP